MNNSRIQFVAKPLLLEWITPDVCTTFEKEVTFYRGGGVEVGNRIIERHEPVDFLHGHTHVFRKSKSDRLTLKCLGENVEQYIFYYRYFFLRGFAWVQLVRRFSK